MHGRQYVIGFFAVILANVAVQLPAYFVRLTIDGLTSRTVAISTIVLYALGVIGGAVLAGFFMLVVRRQITVASRQTEYEIRRDVLAHLTTLDKTYYDRVRTGDLMNRLTGDLLAVREMLGFGAWQIASIVAAFATSFTVMLSISWQLTLLTLVVFPIIIFVLVYLARQISFRYVAVQEQNSSISAKAQENFSGARVVKGYAIEDREIAEYKAMNDDLVKKSIALVRVQGPLNALMSLLMGIAYVVVLVYGGLMILGFVPGGRITLGEFTQFASVVERLAWPMLSIGFMTNLIQRGVASWGRLQEIFSSRPAIADSKRTDTTITDISGDVRFEHVGLKFGQKVALADFNLHVPAGTTLGITGPTGAGKTLVSQLVTRLVEPTSGRVLIDGTDIRAIPLRVLRDKIAVVPQEPFLFSDTIASNIAFGLDNENVPPIPTRIPVTKTQMPPETDVKPDMNRVKSAANLAGLARDVEDFPNQYDTMLGERGVTLSGGQRQRTALARAVIREPRILILDDATSAVDTETEAKILRGLREVQAGRTVFLIGHRVSTLRHADHIVVIDVAPDGSGARIVEQGSHDDLLRLGGHYAELERKQRLASELETDTSDADSQSQEAPSA
ncbi:ABC transporter ATP-binding protein [Deinococcus yavapaiensis]|nr:ABC transporter ATP-binding protein [Deinococcus yavapaiensis]